MNLERIKRDVGSSFKLYSSVMTAFKAFKVFSSIFY